MRSPTRIPEDPLSVSDPGEPDGEHSFKALRAFVWAKNSLPGHGSCCSVPVFLDGRPGLTREIGLRGIPHVAQECRKSGMSMAFPCAPFGRSGSAVLRARLRLGPALRIGWAPGLPRAPPTEPYKCFSHTAPRGGGL
jgi:hypothetical protein